MSRRGLALGSGLAAFLVVVLAAPLWACVPIHGNTWYSDGQVRASGAPGTVLSFFATGAQPNLQFVLVSGRFDGPPPGDARMGCIEQSVPLNPNVRYSNSSGFIPSTSGGVNRLPGDWQICFKEANPPGTNTPWITNAVFFTVL